MSFFILEHKNFEETPKDQPLSEMDIKRTNKFILIVSTSLLNVSRGHAPS